jgi:hypothetical protein
MEITKINSNTKTGKVYLAIFEILKKNPEGLQWTAINKKVEELDPSLHLKTINGCVWKLIENFPNEVYKPSKGLFRLTMYK